MCDLCNVNKTKIENDDKEPSEDLHPAAGLVPAAEDAGVPVQPDHGHGAALAEAGLGGDALGLSRILLTFLARGLHLTCGSAVINLTEK